MPKCEICRKDLKYPNSKSHLNSDFHQSFLKKKIKMKKEGEASELWRFPIYKFRVLKDPNNEADSKVIELVFDVTKSAPSRNVPSESLLEVFEEIFNNYRGLKSILDFGAGKLRITYPLLKKNKEVCAVEFEKLANNEITISKQVKCNRYRGNYKGIIYPHNFLSDKNKYDLGILINVLPFMPIFTERLLALLKIYECLKDKSYLLWYAMREPPKYKKRRLSGKYVCGDGVWMRDKEKTKTFYKYYNPKELDELMFVAGFKLEKTFPDGLNDIRLYKKTKYHIFHNLINKEIIQTHIPFDDSIDTPKKGFKPKELEQGETINLVIPNPKKLSIENLYIQALKRLPDGIENATQYHRLASYILYRVFSNSFRNMDFEREQHRGRKRIDTIFTNSAKEGFFKELPKKYKDIDMNYIIVEAKNFFDDPENPEFDQLNGRLNKRVGNFGILICRTVKKRKLCLERSQSYLDNDNYIICLSDDDLIQLLKLSREGLDEEINDTMDNIFKSLIFKSRK